MRCLKVRRGLRDVNSCTVAIGDLKARLRNIHTRDVAEQLMQYQSWEGEERNLLHGLLGGQPLGDVLPNHFAP
jgi:hypothetical protein